MPAQEKEDTPRSQPRHGLVTNRVTDIFGLPYTPSWSLMCVYCPATSGSSSSSRLSQL